MEDKEGRREPGAKDEPQIYKPEKEEGKWTFSRRAFLTLAATATAGAVVAGVSGVRSAPELPIQLVAHATELSQDGLGPGKPFTKVWYLKNNTALPWGENALLHLTSSEEWQAASPIPLPNLAPGQVARVRVPMVVPARLDPRPVKASTQLGDSVYQVFLPVVCRSFSDLPCTCDSDAPCACDNDIPCTCDSDAPCTCDNDIPCTCDVDICTCDYEIPCTCDVDICTCDYEIPCVCDLDIPCTCDYDCGCVGDVCPTYCVDCGCVGDYCACHIDCGCVGYVPCTCDHYVPCTCDHYVPCSCVAYFPWR